MKSSQTNSPRGNVIRKIRFPLLALLVLALHVTAVFYFVPVELVLGNAPLSNLDCELVATQNATASVSIKQSGHWWSYNPNFNAGIPMGVENDTNSRAWQGWVAWLSQGERFKGMRSGAGANLFVLLAHLFLPVVFFVSARLFGLSRLGTLLAVLAGIFVWFFDGYFHWTWWNGSIAYGFSTYLAVFYLALLYRYCQSGRFGLVAVATLVGASTVFIHAYSAIFLTLTGAIFIIAYFKKLTPWRRVMAIGAVALPLLGNLHWIGIGVSFWSTGDNIPAPSVAGISFLLTDFLGINQDVMATGGIGVRSGFRFLVFGAAAFTFAYWRVQKDDRFRPLLWSVASLLVIAYLGGYVPLVREVQPYRHILLAILLSLIPAGQFVDEVRDRGSLWELPKMAQIVLVLIALAAIPRLARDVVYFVPHFVIVPKDLPEETPHISDIIGFGGIGYPRHRDYRHRPEPEYIAKLAKGLDHWKLSQGRVLVEYAPLAERLIRSTMAHIIGGSPRRNRSLRAADYFSRYPDGDPASQIVSEYFDDYAVGWVVAMSNPDFGEEEYKARFQGMGQLFEGQRRVWPFQVMRTKTKISYFKEGSGRIETGLNRIKIKESPPDQDLVLKFHWQDTFSCRKRCEIKKEPLEGDPLGFIRVLAPHPADFVIENTY